MFTLQPFALSLSCILVGNKAVLIACICLHIFIASFLEYLCHTTQMFKFGQLHCALVLGKRNLAVDVPLLLCCKQCAVPLFFLLFGCLYGLFATLFGKSVLLLLLLPYSLVIIGLDTQPLQRGEVSML